MKRAKTSSLTIAEIKRMRQERHDSGKCGGGCQICQAEKASRPDRRAGVGSPDRFPPGAKTVLLNFRVTLEERAALEALADEHTGGNLSRWLLEAGLGYCPPRS